MNIKRRKKLKMLVSFHSGHYSKWRFRTLLNTTISLIPSADAWRSRAHRFSNNAVSGAHHNPDDSLYNITAHSALTSICRSDSGYGDAESLS